MYTRCRLRRPGNGTFWARDGQISGKGKGSDISPDDLKTIMIDLSLALGASNSGRTWKGRYVRHSHADGDLSIDDGRLTTSRFLSPK